MAPITDITFKAELVCHLVWIEVGKKAYSVGLWSGLILSLYGRHAQHTARGQNVARRGFKFGPPTLIEIK